MDWLAAAVIGALVFAWFGHAFLNYDTFYALVWGSDLAHGRQPDYSVPVAPTPHPLAQLIGIVLTPFGAGAEDLMLAIGLLALGMLVVGLFRAGEELFGVWAGLVAAAIIVTRVPILSYGIRGYVDLATAAFVVWAVVLEVRRPYRGAPVLILFGLAGLLRPEAWLYAGAYWLWLVTTAPRPQMDAELSSAALVDARRTQVVRWTALAVAAPAIWLLSDLLITGNPLHSLTGTHDLAAQLNRRTGITALPSVAPRRLGEILRLPELIAALAGLAFALKWARDRAHLPLVIAVLNGIAYAAFAIARLPLLGRYLFVGASMLALFAGAGALGWLSLPADHPGRRLWKPVGIAALVAIVVFFPLQQVDRLDVTKKDIAARDRVQADLRELVQRADVEPALRACPRIYVLSHRPVPLIALYAGIAPTRIDAVRRPPRRCAVIPRTAEAARLAVLDPNEPGAAFRGYSGPIKARNRSWIFSG
ncbi:MAG TPA: hypothetical protein VH300_17065 [Thermoleophilaceae bacterium]|nr:hypothetical protein [Thermoleophilaceae bacterium]